MKAVLFYHQNIVACLLKAKILTPAETAIARERLCKPHASVATMFSMWFAPAVMSPNYRVTARRGVFCGVQPEAICGELEPMLRQSNLEFGDCECVFRLSVLAVGGQTWLGVRQWPRVAAMKSCCGTGAAEHRI
jgi:hypothetical protein